METRADGAVVKMFLRLLPQPSVFGRSGKSTLSHVIAGKPGYEVAGGEILFEGEDLLAMKPDERAAKGVFLAFQYPVEIPGVATMNFLRTALNAQRKARGEE